MSPATSVVIAVADGFEVVARARSGGHETVEEGCVGEAGIVGEPRRELMRSVQNLLQILQAETECQEIVVRPPTPR